MFDEVLVPSQAESPLTSAESHSPSPRVSPSYHPAFVRDRVEPSPRSARGSVEIHTHATLGLQVLVHRVQDPNKTFCALFSTPHHSANGLPHILEHLVLAGSEEFPVKDPFFATSKGSFNTYLNALTAQEMTSYPVATTNLPELLNLSRIYLDAVFHPRLTDTAFVREGWRVEPGEDGNYKFGGVVYNEMKGAFSDPRDVLYRATCEALYPDTHLGCDSGGDPFHIPTLTREDLLRYHKDHYHPSLAKIVVHGDLSDDDLRSLFALIDEKVRGFDRSDFTPQLPTHTTNPTARHVELEFPADPNKAAGEPLATIAWPLGPVTSAEDRMLWDVLESVLLNGDAALLRKGLIDRGLASSIVMSGVSLNTADAMFLVSGTDVPREAPTRFTNGVREILSEIVRDGISTQAIEAALNEYAFRLKEGSLSTPQGIVLADTIGAVWLRGSDPIVEMDRPAHLNAVRERLLVEPDLLTNLIQDRLLGNPEQVTVTLRPSHEAHTNAINDEQARANAYAEELGEAGVAKALELNERMEAEEDDPSTLEKIPALTVRDLPETLNAFDVISDREAGATTLGGIIPSSGIMYTRLAFDVTHLPDRLLQYVPLLAETLGNADTNRPLVEHEQEVRSLTGGISFGVAAQVDRSTKAERILLVASGAALDERAPDLTRLIGEALFETKIEQKRILEILKQQISNRELHLSRRGHSAAVMEASIATSELYRRHSLLGGFRQLDFLKQLKARVESDWSSVADELNELRAACVTREHAKTGLYCSAERRDAHAAGLETLYNRLPAASEALPDNPAPFTPGAELLGLPINTDVANIGASLQLRIDPDSELVGAMLVLCRAIEYNYLLPEIRGKSGAYGAGASFNPSTGILEAFTYRSKQSSIGGDIKTIKGITDFLASMEISPSELGRLIVGTASDFAQPEHPRVASLHDFQSRLFGRSRAQTEKIYQQIIGCTPERLAQAAELILTADSPLRVRVVSSESALQRAGIEVDTSRAR